MSYKKKNQHYIPQMILRNHFNFQIPMKSPIIYQYDKKTGTERVTKTKEICKERNLYELKDEYGHISEEEQNVIENIFSCYERKWSNTIKKILRQEQLSDEDITCLYLLIALQLIRTPEFIDLISEWLQETSKNIGKPINKNVSDRYTKISAFIWNNENPKANWILYLVLKFVLSDKELVIYHSDTNFILNGNRPVLCINLFKNSDISIDYFLFPVSSHYCLGLINKDKAKSLYMDIPDGMTQFINTENFLNEGRFIYSCKSILEDVEKYANYIT